jgi:hypothetical protein
MLQVRLKEYTEAYQESQNLLKEANDRIAVMERQILGTRQGFAKPLGNNDVTVLEYPNSKAGSRYFHALRRNGSENRTKKYLKP